MDLGAINPDRIRRAIRLEDAHGKPPVTLIPAVRFGGQRKLLLGLSGCKLHDVVHPRPVQSQLHRGVLTLAGEDNGLCGDSHDLREAGYVEAHADGFGGVALPGYSVPGAGAFGDCAGDGNHGHRGQVVVAQYGGLRTACPNGVAVVRGGREFGGERTVGPGHLVVLGVQGKGGGKGAVRERHWNVHQAVAVRRNTLGPDDIVSGLLQLQVYRELVQPTAHLPHAGERVEHLLPFDYCGWGVQRYGERRVVVRYGDCDGSAVRTGHVLAVIVGQYGDGY